MNDFFIFEEPPSQAPARLPRTAPTQAPVERTFNIFNSQAEEEEDALTPVVQPPEFNTPWAKYEGRSLSDEDILKDKDLMAVVDRSLQAMFGGRSGLADTATGIVGGATGGYEGKTPEERLEIWNNFNRSFAGGQSVTTLNTASRIANASDEEKAIIGEGFLLFDQKGNIFTGDNTWGEMFDGVFDYAAAAVWDPVTVASLGVGKVWASGGTKAASMALKATAQTAFKTALKSGATREVARQTAKQATRMGYATLGAKTVAQYSAVDFLANIGKDIAYQDSLIDTGAREDYSFVQTGIVALGSIALPSIIAATKGVEALAKSARAASANSTQRNIFEAYVDVQRKFGGLGPDAIQVAVKNRVDLSKVNGSLKTTFQNFQANLNNYLPWKDAKIASGKVLNSNGVELTGGETQDLFWKSFLFGDKAGTQKGFVFSMEEAGFVYVPRAKDDIPTHFLGDAISWLDDGLVKTFVEDFENNVGKVFSGKVDTAEKLSAAFKSNQSISGSGLWNSKYAQDILTKRGGNAGQLAKTLAGEVNEIHPELGKYTLSVWKRLVTSHPATVGLNVKGWAAMSFLNTTSDIVLGGLRLGEAGVYKLAGKAGAYEAAMNAAKGSLLGGIKRGYNILKFNDTLESAQNYLLLKPELYEDILRTGSGGVDTNNVLRHFNIDPSTPVGKGAGFTENVVGAVQTVYGVRLQDEVTKMLSFHSALEQGILREYGENFNQFMTRPDAYVEMFSPRFKQNVDAWALNRTLRETASKNWSQKQGRGVFLSFAKGVEAISRNAVGGYAVPFGSFMNTAFATLGDYAGFNAVKHLTAKAANKLGVLNYSFNYAEEEGAELIAKGLVGWGGIMAYYLPEALDKLDKGLAWNQYDRGDGTFGDATYDFPESYMKIFAQAAAHGIKDGEVPEALRQEMVNILGGQPFRQMDESGRKVYELLSSVLGGDLDETARNSLEILSGLGTRVVSGFTRPLDPVNQAAIFMSDDYTQIDRKQASSAFLAQSFRYVDQLFGGFDAPAQATPTRGYAVPDQDPGKTLGGVRSSPTPNAIERMLASVGKAPWQAVRWGGDDQVKNVMDGIIGPILNGQAERLLEKEPNFFDLPLASREKRLAEVTDSSKILAEKALEYSFSELSDVISLKNDLAKIPKINVKRAMDYLGIEGDPLDLTKEEGGLAKLETLIFFSKNYEEMLVE